MEEEGCGSEDLMEFDLPLQSAYLVALVTPVSRISEFQGRTKFSSSGDAPKQYHQVHAGKFSCDVALIHDVIYPDEPYCPSSTSCPSLRKFFRDTPLKHS